MWPQSWFDIPIAVFDLETTGFDPQTCQIIEIGIVQFYRGEIMKVHNWLIDPECQIPQEIVDITHIQQSDVDGQPKFCEIVHDVLAAFKDHAICAHNISFDRVFLSHKLTELGLSWPAGNPILDTLIIASHLYPNQQNKLGILAERLGITLEGAHRACNDAEATGKVLYAMREHLPPDLETLMLLQAQWEREFNEKRAFWKNKNSGGSSFSALMNDQTPQNRGITAAFAYSTEPDPIRALYATVPAAKPRDK
jgi:DNA polymerase-3 subunit alpha (Gram-positive type)